MAFPVFGNPDSYNGFSAFGAYRPLFIDEELRCLSHRNALNLLFFILLAIVPNIPDALEAWLRVTFPG